MSNKPLIGIPSLNQLIFGSTMVQPAVNEMLNQFLERGVELNASDIHLTGGMEPYMRLNRGLTRVSDDVLSPHDVEQMAMALMTEQQRQAFLLDNCVDLAFFSESGTRFRVNVFLQRGTTAMAIRRLDEVYRSFKELHLPAQFADVANFENGLVLVTGPTGSGKSTSLAALIHQINSQRPCHIITIEDPVEYVHQNRMGLIRQRELHTDVPSFASAVRAALREDPDVILVGEMRDLETMRAAIIAAETGHLIFSTLHTNDVVGAIGRMIGVFPAEEQKTLREQLSRVMRAVISQRLKLRADGQGRIPVLEIMRVNNAVSNLIRTGEIHQIYSVIQTGNAEGMLLFEQSLADQTAAGLIHVDDATELARDVTIFESRLRTARESLNTAEPVKRRGFSLLRG